jgi:hypothetical protein
MPENQFHTLGFCTTFDGRVEANTIGYGFCQKTHAAVALPRRSELPFLRVEPNELDFRNSRYIAGRSYQKSFELVNYGEGASEYDLQNLATAFGFTVLGW